MAKHNEPDRLSQEATLAIAAGMSYGKWKAMQPLIDMPTEKISDCRTRACQRCGILFLLNKKGNGVKKFCSDDCRDRFYRERKAQIVQEIKQKNNLENKQEVHRTCALCGKDFIAEKWNRKYCGDLCARLAKLVQARQCKQRKKEGLNNGDDKML